MLKITVVTVTYNCRDLIARTLDSVIAQDHDKKIVVIDGGSTDGTLEAIRAYGDLIDVVVSEPDSGIYNAMNKASRYLQPGLVNYLNAGDVYANSKVLSLVASYYEDGVGLIWTDLARYSEGGCSLNRVSQRKGLTHSLKIYQLCHQSVFFYYAPGSIAYSERYGLCADFKLILEYWFGGCRKIHIDAVGVHYLSGGLSDRRTVQMISEKAEIIRRYWPHKFIAMINVAYLRLLRAVL